MHASSPQAAPDNGWRAAQPTIRILVTREPSCHPNVTGYPPTGQSGPGKPKVRRTLRGGNPVHVPEQFQRTRIVAARLRLISPKDQNLHPRLRRQLRLRRWSRKRNSNERCRGQPDFRVHLNSSTPSLRVHRLAVVHSRTRAIRNPTIRFVSVSGL